VRDIPGYEGFYKINDLGEILSVERWVQSSKLQFVPEKWRKPVLHCTGYMVVTLSRDGVSKTHRIHKLVALVFLPRTSNSGESINHINGDKTDNRAINLEWCSPLENTLHAIAQGLMDSRGCKNPSAKLTLDNIKELERLVLSGMSLKEAGSAFNVKAITVAKALDRELGGSWRSSQKEQYRSMSKILKVPTKPDTHVI
jgi:hypothetical protein